MSFETIICLVSCLVHVFFGLVEFFVTHKSLKTVCENCGHVNSVKPNELLNEAQLAALSVFLSSIRGDTNGD